MEPMATKHRAKTNSVRIKDMAFRCVPGSRREQILRYLARLDREGQGMPYLVAAGCSLLALMLGFMAGWWL